MEDASGQFLRGKEKSRIPLEIRLFCVWRFVLEDYDNLAVLVGVCDPLLDLVALKSLDESLDGILVLVAGLDCDDVDVRAVCTFDNETVLGC